MVISHRYRTQDGKMGKQFLVYNDVQCLADNALLQAWCKELIVQRGCVGRWTCLRTVLADGYYWN